MNDYKEIVLDAKVIEGLRELGGSDEPELLMEIIELYLDDAPRLLTEMLRSLDCENLDVMQRSAHTLKSSSANIGGVLLSRVCLAMECAAREMNREEYRRLTIVCQDAFGDLKRALRQIN